MEPETGLRDMEQEQNNAAEKEPQTPPVREAAGETQDPAETHLRRRRRPAQEETVPMPETEEVKPAVPEVKPAVPEEYYPMDRCCICNHPLDTGCAILFTDEHGMARIDEICCNVLNAAARSTDKAEVARAFDFFAAWVPYVKPPVADYLKNYLRVVQTFLNS